MFINATIHTIAQADRGQYRITYTPAYSDTVRTATTRIINGRRKVSIYLADGTRHTVTFARFLYVALTGVLLADGVDVHHKDGNRLNDVIENLIDLPHEEHMRLHGMR